MQARPHLQVSWEWAECSPHFDQPNILFTPKQDGVNAYWWVVRMCLAIGAPSNM